MRRWLYPDPAQAGSYAKLDESGADSTHSKQVQAPPDPSVVGQMRASLEAADEGPGEDARVFAWHFQPVILSGVVAAGDEAEFKAALAALMQPGAGGAAAEEDTSGGYPYHTALINLYIHYGTVRVESNGDCSVLLRRVQWLKVCDAFGESFGDSAMAKEIFEFVNELRDATLQSTKARLLHSGMGLLHSQMLSLSAETSLKLSAFSLSEFIEGIIRCACSPKTGVESPLRRLKTRAQRAGSLESSTNQRAGGAMPIELAVREVKRILDHVVIPHARQLGLAGSERMQAEMAAAPKMEVLHGMCPMHARLYERYSARSTSADLNLNSLSSGANGSVTSGMSIGRFLALAEILTPREWQLGRARFAHAFAQSLPVDALLSSSAARVLSPARFQQALVRLALMRLAAERMESGRHGSEGSVSGCDWGEVPLSGMDAAQLVALRKVLVAMQTAADAAAPREATPRAVTSPEDGAVLAIQKRFRGHHTRRARKQA
jgi:hypothetical protein